MIRTLVSDLDAVVPVESSYEAHAKLRHRLAKVEKLLDLKNDWVAEFPGGLGEAQQCKHMALAACEALGRSWSITSPSDITDEIAELRRKLRRIKRLTRITQ